GFFQPSALGDSVRLVIEPFWIHIEKVGKKLLLEYLGMECRHTVYGKTSDYCQMSHSYLPLPMLFNDRHPADLLCIVRETFSGFEQKFLVDLVDDHEVPGEYMLEKPDRPFFERFRQYCVIRVGKGLTGHLPGFIPGESFMVYEDPHKLRDA